MAGEKREAFGRVACDVFRKLIAAPEFSCVGAKAALNADAFRLVAYDRLAEPQSTKLLANDLEEFARSVAQQSSDYASFIAVFREPAALTELEFEECLWQQLRELHQLDPREWDPNVSPDPNAANFSFSFAGRSFYVLGMHRNSSRPARRFSWPTLVFNPHEQFERLRSEGKWRRMQHTIRERELSNHGSINPMLSDFGEQSEARQYSGRVVANDWTPPVPETGGKGKCPFGH